MLFILTLFILLCYSTIVKEAFYESGIYEKKPILPLVISMALPMTISMLVNALYNIVDGYFVAKSVKMQ